MNIKSIYKKSPSSILATFLAAVIWFLTASTSVFAADFTVNATNDAVDNDTTDGVCAAASGSCTLRAAIMQANATPGADTITIPAVNDNPTTYQLTINGVDERCDVANPDPTPCTIDGTTGAYVPVVSWDASMGDLDITDDVTITGAGSDRVRIEWTATSPGVPLEGDDNPLSGDRIFHVGIPADATADIASVVIQGLTVVNGEVGLVPTTAADVCVDDGTGTGTLVYDDTNLNAYDIDASSNTTDNCGTLDTDGKIVGGTIKIDQFRRMGGGIAIGSGYAVVTYDEAKTGSPPDDITGGEGGAFVIDSVSLNDVVVINNWSGADGGGIHSILPATINQSIISGNTSAGGNGGGLYNEANLTISETLIGKVFDTDTAAAHPELTHRNSGENGGGIFFTGAPQTTTMILRSAINGNYAIGGAGIAGREATFNITNTTISSNEAKDVGAGIITAGDVYLLNVTVADNVATTPATSGGAGLNGFSNARFFLSNTLLSNNQFIYPDKPIRRDNCGMVGSNAQFISQGYNLEDGDSCEFGVTDQVNTDPLLVALADNGGRTETHLIPHSAIAGGVDSPAVDAGNSDPSVCPNNDQRTYPRPIDGNGDGVKDCDIGAFELSNITADLQISNMVAPDAITTGSDYNVTISITNGAVDTDTNITLVTDALPSVVTFVSATTTVGSCAEASGVVTCNIGDLDGTSSATVTLTLTAAAAGEATITANVTSTTEPDASTEPNNTASVLTTIRSTSSDDGGGWCSYNPEGRFDPVFPALLLIGLALIIWRRLATRKQ